MRSRHVRIGLIVLAGLLALTVPQTLAAHITMHSQETAFRDEFLLLQLRMPESAWALGGLPGYLFWILALVVPAAFAFFPRLRKWGAGAAGLLLGVALVAGAAPKAYLAALVLLGANLLPTGWALRWPRAASTA